MLRVAAERRLQDKSNKARADTKSSERAVR